VQQVIKAIDWLSSVGGMAHWHSIVDIPCEAGDVNRLKARHDAARRFASVRWSEGEEYRTVGGCYSELVGLTLAYSAFDYMRDVCFRIGPRDWKGRRIFYATLDLSPLDESMQITDRLFPNRALATRLAPLVNKPLTERLEDINEPWPALRLSEAIRHSFVHGKLSPSGGGVEAGELQQVCGALRVGLLDVVTQHMMQTVDAPIHQMYCGD